MDKSTRIAISLVVTVLFVGFKVAARSSRRSTYSSSSYDSTYRRDLERARIEQFIAREEDRNRLVEEEQRSIRSLSEPHCAAERSVELMLELQSEDRDTLMLRDLSWVKLLPQGTSFPASVKVAGLDVVVLERKGEVEGSHPVCLDSDLTLAKRVALGTRLSRTTFTRVDGAVVVATKDSTAAQTLLAADLKDVLGAKGNVVAFAGSDNLVSFADSSDVKAVRAAALASAQQLDTTGAGGCIRVEPLVLRNGAWSPWAPPAALKTEVEAHRRAAKACLRSMLQNQLTEYEDDGATSPSAFGHPTERRFDQTAGSIAKVSLARSTGEQLVVKADQVELAHDDGRRTLLSWPAFERAAKNGLLHASIRSFRIDDAWFFDPQMVASLDTASNEKLKSLK